LSESSTHRHRKGHRARAFRSRCQLHRKREPGDRSLELCHAERNKAIEQGKWDVDREQLGDLESKKRALEEARDTLRPLRDPAVE